MKKSLFSILSLSLMLPLMPLQTVENEPSSSIYDLSKPFAAVVERALPSVVFIAIEQNSFDLTYPSNTDSFYEYFRPFHEWLWPSVFGHGSGFIMSPDG